MPGFTPVSMFPLMWQASGLDYPALVDRLVQTALRRDPACASGFARGSPAAAARLDRRGEVGERRGRLGRGTRAGRVPRRR